MEIILVLALSLTFRPIVHFESDMGVEFHYFASRSKFFNLIFSIKNNEKKYYSFSIKLPWHLYQKLIDCICVGLFLTYSVPLLNVSILKSILHYFI